nr:no-on-and-no-off transient C [Cucujiformia]
FPAVVGALEGGLKFDFSEITLPKDCLSQNNEVNDEEADNYDEDNYESDTEDTAMSNTLQTCFKTMVDTLSKQDPETIAQVQTLVKELRRITLLWDELWLGTLSQHQSEILKRQHQLEYEIDKVNDNANLSKEEKISLIAEKHRIIIRPIIFILEQLQDVTSMEAETPHEKMFQEKYLQDINDVISKLKNPDHPEKPQESLLPLKQLQKKFQQKFHKRASYLLKMQDISPVLANMKNTVIAMPGLVTAKKSVTINHISNGVSILPTKTKPKKLVFYGSDGQTYTYLFKGLEDLHLDERIMQFLSIANTMMAQITDPSGQNLYRARHYSVIPLGPRSGLISWVDGTTPTFALYKRWQQREIAKANIKNTSNTNTGTVPRPSELFYNKLNPLLLEHGVKNIENRKEWPLSVLKQVLTELMNETPSDLLAKELWCNSINANMWWQVVKRYSYSVAVMSMIGYIIGLGDRHLDNVLIDLTCGDVVHIDYNVC